MIDPKTQEIKPASDETYSDMLDLADELPDSSPRFVLLSYPLTLVLSPFNCSCGEADADHRFQASGRISVPYVLLYYLPENCNPSSRMMYAGAVELMRTTAEVNRVVEIESGEELEDIETRLAGGEQ
jgi:Cofilin/tropomyosin-type actin-binding protein